jgi:hypothetical protein
MSATLEEKYPEAAEYIHQAVEEHGEQWVIENYFPKITQLGVIMDVPPIEELPFYDERKHTAPSEQEKRERAKAYGKYLENLRTGNKPEKE